MAKNAGKVTVPSGRLLRRPASVSTSSAPAAVSAATTKAEAQAILDATAEIQSDHSKATFGYLLAQVRQLQKGNK